MIFDKNVLTIPSLPFGIYLTLGAKCEKCDTINTITIRKWRNSENKKKKKIIIFIGVVTTSSSLNCFSSVKILLLL